MTQSMQQTPLPEVTKNRLSLLSPLSLDQEKSWGDLCFFVNASWVEVPSDLPTVAEEVRETGYQIHPHGDRIMIRQEQLPPDKWWDPPSQKEVLRKYLLPGGEPAGDLSIEGPYSSNGIALYQIDPMKKKSGSASYEEFTIAAFGAFHVYLFSLQQETITGTRIHELLDLLETVHIIESAPETENE